MFATNFPVDKVASSYAQVVQAFRDISADFAAADVHKLFHDNATRLYRI
jgi:predicted TIM-barrel fold metal-dependent hydrolase